ncbi:MAG: hypothetical protein JNK82_04180 [Myxococcaceae bacterium]|nr:hypothetical protein [Myxococcaceae bacterium]
MTFEQYVEQLAAAPHDRAQHAVFADWLLERGDARGEALALELQGETERLRLMQTAHAAAWLGPAAEGVELARCAFYGPFPTRLSFKRGAKVPPLPPTVRYLCADWRALPAVASASPKHLETLEVIVGLGMAFSDFRALADELDAVAPIASENLELQLDTFAGVEAAMFLAAGFLRSALAARPTVTLSVRDGSLDAAAAWLCQAESWGGGDRWGARWGGALVQLARDRLGHFTQLEVDLAFQDEKAIAARAASAAAVLSQLRRLNPTSLEVRYPEGQRVGKRLRDTLAAPLRFLPHVRKVGRKK